MQSLTTKQVIVRIVSIVASVEFLIMLLLGFVPLKLSLISKAVLDIALLALIATPPLYIWVINPFVAARDDALDQIKHLAHTDPLTQLPNRRLVLIHLEKFMAEIVRHKFCGAVLLLDLDGFKAVNDDHGHEAGDEVLIEVAKRLQSTTRSEDVAGRLGGDEFVILARHLDSDEQIARDFALRLADKLIDLVKEPIEFNGTTLNIDTSIGIRLLGYEDLDIRTVIREADIALYRAKRSGRGRAMVFEK
ncbi:MAG: GGDEF domain-containing protein [Gammaproteobacteria bacterium]|nr:GGDEF domain-containing protein [Gammaproteobacteria bacterium]